MEVESAVLTMAESALVSGWARKQNCVHNSMSFSLIGLACYKILKYHVDIGNFSEMLDTTSTEYILLWEAYHVLISFKERVFEVVRASQDRRS